MPQEYKNITKLSRAFRDAKNKVVAFARDLKDAALTDPDAAPAASLVLVPVRISQR